MKILSGYNHISPRSGYDIKPFPVREIKLHLASYKENGFDNVFYSSYDFQYDSVCIKEIKDFRSTNGLVFKHEMIQRFFEDFPEENEVIYVDCDTLLNDSFNSEDLRCDTGFSISKYSNKNQFQSGVMYLSKEFVKKHYDNLLDKLNCEITIKGNEKFNDEHYLQRYVENNIDYTLMSIEYNFSMHRCRRFDPNTMKPKILHFHIELNKQRRKMRKYFSNYLQELIVKYYG